MKYLTPEQYAKARKRPVTAYTVRRWCQSGLIDHVKDGRNILIPETEIERELDFSRQEPDPGVNYLTAKQFAATRPSAVDPETVRRWCRLGLLDHIRDGRRVLIPESEVGKEISFKAGEDPTTPTPPSLRAAEAELAKIVIPMKHVPIYGTAPCGPGEFIEEGNIEGWAYLPADEKDDIIAVRAKGESMIDVGIMPGDVLSVKRLKNGQHPKGGSVVLAWSNMAEGMTIKTYLTSPKRLVAQNKAQPAEWPLEEGDAIMGVVVRVTREM